MIYMISRHSTVTRWAGPEPNINRFHWGYFILISYKWSYGPLFITARDPPCMILFYYDTASEYLVSEVGRVFF